MSLVLTYTTPSHSELFCNFTQFLKEGFHEPQTQYGRRICTNCSTFYSAYHCWYYICCWWLLNQIFNFIFVKYYTSSSLSLRVQFKQFISKKEKYTIKIPLLLSGIFPFKIKFFKLISNSK